MSLSSSCLLGFSGLILSILLGNSSFNLIFVVVLLPIGFPLHLLFEQYVFFSSLVDIFEQINSSLVLSCPLCISHFELSLSFLFDNFVNHRFIFSFVIFALSVVDLEVNNFLSSFSSKSIMAYSLSILALRRCLSLYFSVWSYINLSSLSAALWFINSMFLSRFNMNFYLSASLSDSISIAHCFLSMSCSTNCLAPWVWAT